MLIIEASVMKLYDQEAHLEFYCISKGEFRKVPLRCETGIKS